MNICVFRKRLLAYTETFISQQGLNLPSYEAVFSGFEKDHKGFFLLTNERANIELEGGYSLFPKLSSGLHKKFGLVNRKWLNALKKKNIKLIHAHFGTDGLVAIPLAKKLGVPLITTFHGFDITINTPLNHYRRNRHQVWEHSHKVIAVSKFIKNQLLEKGCPESKIIQHYIGVDCDRFSPSPNPPQKGKIVFIGRLVDKKGARHLIQAMPKIQASVPYAQLEIIGDGPLRSALEKEAKALRANTIFTGKKPPEFVVNELKTAEVLCAPSVTATSGDQEGLPISIMEALASGVPVISSYSAGIAEAISDGENGYLLEEADQEGIANRIINLLTNPELRSSQAKHARQTALEKFNLARQCQKLEKIYENVINEGI